MRSFYHQLTLVVLFFLIVFLSGCTPEQYRQSADKEAYRIIQDKSPQVEGMAPDFSIESVTAAVTIDGASRVIDLAEALEMAVRHSRSYQSRRESLYNQALSLSSERHEFDWIPSSSGNADYQRTADDRDDVSASLSQGLSKMMATGADLSVNLATSLSRIISGGDPAEVAVSTLSLSVSQPLLRGAGRKIATENLTQAERNMIFEIRDFVRFQRNFSVDVAQDYYNLLQQLDQVYNARASYERFRENRLREEALARAGRLGEFNVDQTRQREFSARDQWLRARQNYQNALDSFKITLGLPTDLELHPDPAELNTLSESGFQPLAFSVEEAINSALFQRLDLKTQEDRREDALRKVEVAEDALKRRLDLSLFFNKSTEDDKPALHFSGGDETKGGGIDYTLPLDRKNQRNSYRRSLIAVDATERNLTEQVDRIKQEVRNAYRAVLRAEQSYQIQKLGLELAERRVDSTMLLRDAGRAVTRDVNEAQDSLTDAQNALSQALVDHFNAKLDLFLAIETLRVDEKGFWGELEEVQVGQLDEEGNVGRTGITDDLYSEEPQARVPEMEVEQ